MDIQILHLIEGAKQARGLTVVIDVFRAFSVACYVTANGAEKIVPVGDINIAYRLKSENPGFILIGEREMKIQPGFDYGNSPTHIEKVDFSGKTVIQTTSAGTQGIANAIHADEIITGSFVNARSIAGYIKKQNPERVSLVCMGNAGISEAEEDIRCAEYIKSLIEGQPIDTGIIHEHLRRSSRGEMFFDRANEGWAPQRDFHLCLDFNRFNFVLKVEPYGDSLVYLKKL